MLPRLASLSSFSPGAASGRPGALRLCKRLALLLLVATAGWLCSWPAWAGLTGPETALDKRVKAYLQAADKRWPPLAENASYPKPNNELKYGFGEAEYYAKALAVFGLIDMGAAPQSRKAEVNRYLRYAVLGKWPATAPGSVVGQYAQVWNHRDRNLAMRLYMLYSAWMEADVKAEWEKRIQWLATKPYTSSSENIRWSNNAAYFLAYEVLGQTNTQGFKDVKSWVVKQLKSQGNSGPNEWGSFYNAWTYGAILNLADFASDPQVKKLARMAFDIWLARHAGASHSGRLGTGGVRCYPWWIHGVLRGQTTCAQLMMTGNPEASGGDWLEFAITNYRAPSTVAAMHGRSGTWEAWVKSGTQADMRYYHYHGDKFLLGVTMSPELPDVFRSFGGGTHDIAGVYVQSAAAKPGRKTGQSSVMLLGYRPEKPPAKRINLRERYFGYKHVAFAQHGGTTKAVYAGGIFRKIPIRLFATHDFSREFDSGWAFLTNGTTYVAWAPTIGDPQNDPDSTGWYDPNKQGFVLKSSYQGDDKGEASVLDIGDAASYGSYANFKTQIKKRNPRPRWTNGKVTYKALDGTTIEWSDNGAKVNGVAWSRSKAPATTMPGLQGLKITQGGANITYNFNTETTTGTIQRISSNMLFGASATKPPPGPLAIQTPAQLPGGTVGVAFGPVKLTATGGTPPYKAWKVIGTSPLPDGITLTEPTGVLGGTPTKVGSFQTRIRVTDDAGKVQSKVFAFTIAANTKGAPPNAIGKPFVHSNNAQGGHAGNPVPDIDLSPVFSAIFTDPDTGDTAEKFYIQVSTDDTFETVDGWNSGVTPLPRPVAHGARCADIPYAGQPLQPGKLYYWRMIFIDKAGNWGALHTEQLSFKTANANNNAPLAASGLYVGSTSAQSGAPGTTSKPATGIDLSPVFSAVFEDPDSGDTTTELWVQLATDPSFKASSLLWNAVPFGEGTGALTIGSCVAGNRCADFAYAGKPLSENTQYYWRILFVDKAGQVGLASETASFFTSSSSPQALAIATTSLADATEGKGYSQSLAATGGSAPYAWKADGNLPSGLSLDAQGSLFGTPAAGTAGGHSIALTVTDADGKTASATLSLQILASQTSDDGGAPDGPTPPDTPTTNEGNPGQDVGGVDRNPIPGEHGFPHWEDPPRKDNGSDQGCGCHVDTTSSPTGALLLLLLGLLLAISARRRTTTQ